MEFTAGKIGELFISMAFASALVAVISFLIAENREGLEKRSWERMGIGSFALHAASILGVIATLFFLIYTHRYEYHYPWAHSSNELPVYYMISCFWEGQEGSFLLWCFWHSVLGMILLRGKGEWRNTVIAVIASVEVILVSMLLGAYFFGIKIGSSPFILLKDVYPEAEAYLNNPDFIPSNGNGLNTLLQNYWMVIHPPTLFLGFAATVVPFAYAVAGLWRGRYTSWIRPAMPWLTFSVMILGVGIIMGGYWAYETLNFGGYWNWDPVENSSLVPWLCGVAALHSLLIFQKSKAYLGLSMIMIISTFLLVLYSTFLTRSGILGETSVHTFTDLGLSGQLILLVAVYTLGVIALLIYRAKDIPQRQDESKLWSAEFMLFLGVLVFAFAGLIIILATSLPVFNTILGTNAALPSNEQYFFYQWMVWFASLFGLLSGIGQFLWWKRVEKRKLGEVLLRPFMIALLSALAIIVGLAFSQWQFAYDPIYAEIISPERLAQANALQVLGAYLKFGFLSLADEILLFAALFGFFANMDVLISILRRNKKGLKVMGGTVVHIGFALMLIGMLFSSGYDRVISQNIRPADFAAAAMTEQEKADNVRLNKWHTTPIQGYQVTYIGKKEAQAPFSDFEIIEEGPFAFKVRFDDAMGERYASVLQPRVVFLKRDESGAVAPHGAGNAQRVADLEGQVDLELVRQVLEGNPRGFPTGLINDRTQYGLHFASNLSPADTFLLYPEAEVNEEMQSIIAHPSRRIYWDRDVYVYTSSLPDPRNLQPKRFDFQLRVGEVAEAGDVKLMLAKVENVSHQAAYRDYTVAAMAYIVAFTEQDTVGLRPVYFIDGSIPGMVPDEYREWGLEASFVGVDPQQDLIMLQVEQVNPGADFVTIKALVKPYINLLWLGTFILVIGFLIAIYRRVQENRKRSAKA